MWLFLIGVIVGTIIGVFILGLMSAAPECEEKDEDNEDKRGGIL